MNMRATLRTFAVATLLVAPGAAAQGTPSSEGRNLAATCTGCHGTGGVSQGGMPMLAGQPKDELVRKMQEFRTGARPGTIMPQLAKGYTDPQLEAMGAYFAAQAPR